MISFTRFTHNCNVYDVVGGIGIASPGSRLVGQRRFATRPFIWDFITGGGLAVVAYGTSASEMSVSVMLSLQGKS